MHGYGCWTVQQLLKNGYPGLTGAGFRSAGRIDGDTVLMRDIYPATVLVGYQFILRWTNAHAMWLKRLSPLSTRILTTLMTMPLNHPRLKEDIIANVGPPAALRMHPCMGSFYHVLLRGPFGVVLNMPARSAYSYSSRKWLMAHDVPAASEGAFLGYPRHASSVCTGVTCWLNTHLSSVLPQVCRPNGYYSVVDHENFTDLWAFCVLRMVIRYNNSGPDPDNILYDQPLGCAAQLPSTIYSLYP